jgi:hypothetical protein
VQGVEFPTQRFAATWELDKDQQAENWRDFAFACMYEN